MSAILKQDIAIPSGVNGPARVVPIEADLRREYVASRANVWGIYADSIHALPPAIDDVTRDLGDDLYEKMALDPEVAALLNTLKAAILSQDAELTTAIDDPEHPDYAAAETIKDFCQRSLRRIRPTAHATFENLLDALHVANKVAEVVYEEGDGEDAGKYVLAKLAVKHRRSISFVVDPFGNVVGFLGIRPGAGVLAPLGMIIYDPARDNLLPREKFAVLALRARDGDPRGTSILRPAYNVWWLKMQTWPELLKYLAQFGSASVIGFTAPDARDQIIYAADGTTVIARLSAQDAQLGQLELWKAGGAASFPHGSDVKIVQAVGNGEAFHKAITLFDQQISKAVTGQILATSEGEHEARAASQVHQDMLMLLVMALKLALAQMVIDDILRPLVAVNFGDAMKRLTPDVSFGEVSKEDIGPILTAAVAAGYAFDPSQFADLDAQFGMPPRDPDSIEAAIARRNAPPIVAPPAVAPPADPAAPPPDAKEQP